jgi:hypothetical protein
MTARAETATSAFARPWPVIFPHAIDRASFLSRTDY